MMNTKRKTQNAKQRRRRLQSALFALCVLTFAVAASPSEDLIRLGNEAYLRGDLVAAEQHYAAAAERATDPGLVAFNRAAVALQLGEPREAELHYLQTLDDRAAPPDRRAKALYNRGVCLLDRGGSAAVYRSAVACFEQALKSFGDVDPLAADARHNLELAKVRWAKARESEATRPKPNELPPDVPEPVPPEPRPGSDPGPEEMGQPSTMQAEPAPGPTPGGTPGETDQPTPGPGHLPVVLDTDRLQPLTPEDTRALLQRAAERLEKDRRATARMLVGPERPNVKDW